MITLWLLNRFDGEPIADMIVLDGPWLTNADGFTYFEPVSTEVFRSCPRADVIGVLDWHGRRIPSRISLSDNVRAYDCIVLLEVSVDHEDVAA